MAKKSRKRIVEVPKGAQVINVDENTGLLLRLGYEVASKVPSRGLGVALFHDCKFVSSEPSVVVKTMLAFMDEGDALKAMCTSCDCEDCREFAGFPSTALAVGHRKHFQEYVGGRFDGLTPAQKRARLMEFIRQAVEL